MNIWTWSSFFAFIQKRSLVKIRWIQIKPYSLSSLAGIKIRSAYCDIVIHFSAIGPCGGFRNSTISRCSEQLFANSFSRPEGTIIRTNNRWPSRNTCFIPSIVFFSLCTYYFKHFLYFISASNFVTQIVCDKILTRYTHVRFFIFLYIFQLP